MNIKAIALYLALTALILFLLSEYVARSKMYSAMSERVDNNYSRLVEYEKSPAENNVHILVIGNSNVNASINLEDNHENVVPFIISGMPLLDIVRIVENLPGHPVITTLLIGVGYNYATPVNARSSIYEKHSAENPLTKKWYSLPLVRGQSLTVTILKEDLKCILALVNLATCSKTEVKGEGDGSSIDANSQGGGSAKKLIAMKKSTRKRLREYQPFTSSVSPEFVNSIRRIKAAANSRGIDLHMYTAPVYKELREKLSPDFLTNFRSVMKDNDIDYVDLNLVFIDWGPEMFGDATHVEKLTTGKITTEYLFGRILSRDQ